MLSTDRPNTVRPSSSMTIWNARRLSRRSSGVTGPRCGLGSLTGACDSAARRTRTRVGGEAADEFGHLAAHRARHGVLGVRVAVDDGPRDEAADDAHLLLTHPLRRDARGADPDAGGDVWLLRVERD